MLLTVFLGVRAHFDLSLRVGKYMFYVRLVFLVSSGLHLSYLFPLSLLRASWATLAPLLSNHGSPPLSTQP